jgi:hypothetical protein
MDPAGGCNDTILLLPVDRDDKDCEGDIESVK